MAITSTIYITGNIVGKPTGSEQINATIFGTTYGLVSVVLQSGNNTITVPVASTKGCMITLQPSNTYEVTLKGVNGDTGITIGKTGTTVLNWTSGTPPSTFVLNTGTLHTAGPTYITFF